jgi:hypothetical protein
MSLSSTSRYETGKQFEAYIRDTTRRYHELFTSIALSEGARCTVEGLDLRVFERLVDIMNHAERGSVKQLRPTLVRLGYDLFNSSEILDDWVWILVVCVVVQIKDNGYYMLDRVLDLGEDLSPVFGSACIVVANYLLKNYLTRDVLESRQLNYDTVKRLLYEELHTLDIDNLYGACADNALINVRWDADVYFQKTKHYSFYGSTFAIGAILAGQSEETMGEIRRVGVLIGESIIMANDAWDIGKNCEDFRSGKWTYANYAFFEKIPATMQVFFKQLFGSGDIDLSGIHAIRHHYVCSGAFKMAKEAAIVRKNDAIAQLKQISGLNPAIVRFIEYEAGRVERNQFYSPNTSPFRARMTLPVDMSVTVC